MTKASKLAFTAALSAVAVLGACTDRQPDKGMPTAPKAIQGATANTMGTCTDLAALNALAAQVFGAGSPNVNSVLGKLDNLRKKVEAGDVAGAQVKANEIVQFIRDKAAEGRLAGTTEQVNNFIAKILCYAGLSPNTFLIQPTDQPQVIVGSDGSAGVSLAANTVSVPTLLTITTLPQTGPPPLITELDQYPSYVSITVSSNLNQPADVRVCPTGAIPTSVRARLRLGHQATGGFDITPPPGRPSFDVCPAQLASASQSRTPGWLRAVASIFMPKPLYARIVLREEARGGVGGSVTEFSPFGAVDPELGMDRGGVGGSVTEFKKTNPTRPGFSPATPATPATSPLGPTPSPETPTGIAFVGGGRALAVDPCATQVNSLVSEACRPSIYIETQGLHNSMAGVPVVWNVVAGGGWIGTTNGSGCNVTDQTTLTTTTGANGTTAVCFKVGSDTGTLNNKVRATPQFGGDAPEGVTFVGPLGTGHSGLEYAVTGTRITPVATLTNNPLTVQYKGSAFAGEGTCSISLTPVFSYAKDGSALASAPSDVGTYDYTVTCGDGNNVYNTVSDTKSITISAIVPTITVTCTTLIYDGTAQTPCSATVAALGSPVSGATVTWEYANNRTVGWATATASFAANGNYGAATGSGTFAITAAPTITSISCTGASFTYTGAAITPCSATTTGAGSLNVPTIVTYAGNIDAGTATVTATYAAGGNYLGSSGTGSFAVTAAATTTSVTCSPASLSYTGSPFTPCTATATGPGGLNAAVPVSYSANTAVGTAGASAAFDATNNYLGSSGTGSFAITPAATSTNVSCPAASFTYTGSAIAPCSGTTTGPGGLSVATAVTYVANLDIGTATATATYAAAGNYAGSAGSATFAITPVIPTVAVSCSPASVTYDGLPRTPCTSTVTAPGGLNATPTPVYANNVNAGTANAAVNFVATGNYGAASGSATFEITKAVSFTSVSCAVPVTYSGSSQTLCTASASGAGGLSTAVTPVGYTDNTNAGTASASATYAGDANHSGSSGIATFTIDKASSTTTVSCSDVTYNGAARTPCSTSTTGVGGLSQAVAIVYANNTNAGTAGASATFGGDANHTGSSDSKLFAIGKAGSVTSVSCPASVSYTGSALTPCTAGATSAGGLNQSLTVSYTNNVNAGAAGASATFTGDPNHTSSANTSGFTIAQLNSTTTVSCPVSVPYTGTPQTPCSAAVLGLYGLSQPVTPVTYLSNLVGTATASATYAGGTNWLTSTGSSTFQVLYVQSGCFSSPLTTSPPPRNVTVRKGSNLPVKCTLLTSTGAAVTNATGSLTVEDRGTLPILTSVVPFMTVPSNLAFKQDANKNYAYGLDTSPNAFVAGRYYVVTAHWNDGSKSSGWFVVK